MKHNFIFYYLEQQSFGYSFSLNLALNLALSLLINCCWCKYRLTRKLTIASISVSPARYDKSSTCFRYLWTPGNSDLVPGYCCAGVWSRRRPLSGLWSAWLMKWPVMTRAIEMCASAKLSQPYKNKRKIWAQCFHKNNKIKPFVPNFKNILRSHALLGYVTRKLWCMQNWSRWCNYLTIYFHQNVTNVIISRLSMCCSSFERFRKYGTSWKLQYLLTLFLRKLHFVTVVCTMLKGSVYRQTLPYYCLIDFTIETSQQAFRA